MSNSTLKVDPRIIPLVRSLKDQSVKPTNNNTIQDISSEKTSENSAKIKDNKKDEEENKTSEEKTKKKEDKKSKKNNNIKSNNNNNSNTRLQGIYNTMIRKKSATKISIDGSADNKIKIGTSENNNQRQRGIHHNSTNKIKIISKSKDQQFNPTNTFQIPTSLMKQKKDYNHDYNRIKTRTKYVQNLLSDMNLKKYKQICIDLIKNDNVVKKLYEQAGLEKTNFSYEIFIQNNFFNQPLFMFKLEMLFFDESNFNKKNFKENFFRHEIAKYLEHFTNQEIYKSQMNSLKDVFKNGFDSINNFDLFHD